MIPHVFSPILKQDFTLRPFQVHKKHYIEYTQVQDSSSGYMIWDAHYNSKKVPIGTNQTSNYATNSFDGSYKSVIWNWIDAQYYRYPYDAYASLEHTSPNWTYKFLNHSASIISIPYHDMGEKIKPGSFQLTCSVDSNIFHISDDGYGNLYIPQHHLAFSASIYSYGIDNKLLRINPNRIYTQIGSKWMTNRAGTLETPEASAVDESYRMVSEILVPYTSHEISSGYGIGKNIIFCESDQSHETTMFFGYSTGSGIWLKNIDDFNFPNGDFTIMVKLRINQNINHDSSYHIETLVDKKSVITSDIYGIGTSTHTNNQIFNSEVGREYNKTINNATPIYPYWLYYTVTGSNYTHNFKASDGITTVHLSSSAGTPGDNTWISATRSGSLYTLLYLNNPVSTATFAGTISNKHDVCIGSAGTQMNDYFRGDIEDVRFYNKALSEFQIGLIVHENPRDTVCVGNIFYKTGIVVINNVHPKDPAYTFAPTAPNVFSKLHRLFDAQWYMQYRGTHTIYQYEILSRIKKGDFNLSQNPSARQNYATDLLIDDMVTGSLYPYATSIGYYNDTGELMAVAKLNQPLAMRDDVDLNIIARWDA